MNNRIFTPYLVVIVLFFSQFASAQNSGSVKDPWLYIQTYYLTFTSGYYLEGEYVAMTKNYKVSLKDSIFNMEYDYYNRDKEKERISLSINLKQVVGIEPYGTNVVEVFDEIHYALTISENLKFITTDESFIIQIYHEADEDVEQSDIYIAFSQLIVRNK